MIWEAPDFDETQRIVDARELPEDARAEQSLRPKSLDDSLAPRVWARRRLPASW